jgi:SAM-dependent methyltransferase
MITERNLQFIRAYELDLLARRLKPGSSVLEIGAGTGFQARALSDRGFKVTAIDLRNSPHQKVRLFDVIEYDGKTLPFPDKFFDVVFTSNVLEHVSSLNGLLAEMRRVLRRDGYCVHAMPTVTWRIWTSLSGYLDLPAYVLAGVTGRLQLGFRQFSRMAAGHVIPRSHGKVYPLIAEFWTFSRRYWVRRFRENGFDVIHAEPMGLFYTGWSAFGSSLSIENRKYLAKLLGSSCAAYVVRPAYDR